MQDRVNFCKFGQKWGFFFDGIIFCSTFALSKKWTDSVAQLVEHIPFKDGVLGSSPSWITRQQTAAFFIVCSRTRHPCRLAAPERSAPEKRKGSAFRADPLSFSTERCYFESTGICLLIDSSRDISVSVRITPGIACTLSVSTSRRCSLSRV